MVYLLKGNYKAKDDFMRIKNSSYNVLLDIIQLIQRKKKEETMKIYILKNL